MYYFRRKLLKLINEIWWFLSASFFVTNSLFGVMGNFGNFGKLQNLKNTRNNEISMQVLNLGTQAQVKNYGDAVCSSSIIIKQDGTLCKVR